MRRRAGILEREVLRREHAVVQNGQFGADVDGALTGPQAAQPSRGYATAHSVSRGARRAGTAGGAPLELSGAAPIIR